MEPTPKLKKAVIDYKNGKSEAFAILYEESCKYIYVCIYKIVKDCSDAQEAINDLMQETYLEISCHISQLEDEGRFLSWAGSIATRKCYAYLKKNRQYVLLSQEEDILENLTDDEDIIPEEILQEREKLRLIMDIIDTQLTPMQRLCVIAYYYHEQKQSEIARELGIPENTVKTNLSRAKTKIKEGILDLEKKEGTRLYSLAPLLLLLFQGEQEMCVVPRKITEFILGTSKPITGAGKTGTEKAGTGSGKARAAALRAKIIVGVIGVAAVGAVVAGVLVSARRSSEAPGQSLAPPMDALDYTGAPEYAETPQYTETPQSTEVSQEIQLYESWPEWAVTGKEYLLTLYPGDEFDIKDFEEDGVPEIVIFGEEALYIAAYQNGEWTSQEFAVMTEDPNITMQIIERLGNNYHVSIEYIRSTESLNRTISSQAVTVIGYGVECNEVMGITLQRNHLYSGSEEMFGIFSIVYNKSEFKDAYKVEARNYRDGHQNYITWEGEPGVENIVDDQDGITALRELAACFNEIILTEVETSAIEERFTEFLEYGNRTRTRRTEEEVDEIFHWAKNNEIFTSGDNP